jgi:hypothetical protein
MTTTHRGRHPTRGRQPPSRCGNLALQPAPVPTAQPPATGALHAGLAGLVAQPGKRGRPPSPHLARVRHRPPLTNATSAASPASGPARPPLEPLQDAAASSFRLPPPRLACRSPTVPATTASSSTALRCARGRTSAPNSASPWMSLPTASSASCTRC